MNTVYVLSIHHNDEAGTNIGVFSSENAAMMYAINENLGELNGGYGQVEIEKFAVDKLLERSLV